MNPLNFNEPKILKALLDKTKTSTIRKAWGECKGCYKCEYLQGDGECSHEPENVYDKPCKYKVGDVVEVVWKGKIDYMDKIIWHSNQAKVEASVGILGKVKITSIEAIEISKTGIASSFCSTVISYWWSKYVKEIVQSEGFKDHKEMFTYLEKYANGLEEPKKFYLIKYEWIK